MGNISGQPVPPTGLHPVKDTSTVIIPLGGQKPVSEPTGLPAPNSTGEPTPPSGFHPFSNQPAPVVPPSGVPAARVPAERRAPTERAPNAHKGAGGRWFLRRLLRRPGSYDTLESIW